MIGQTYKKKMCCFGVVLVSIPTNHSNKGQSPRSLSTNSQCSANGAPSSIIWYHVTTERDDVVKCQRQTVAFQPKASPLPFSGSTVLSLLADQRGIKSPPAVCQRAEGCQTFETSRPTWVSVQDVVLNKPKDRPRNQVNRSQSSATFTTHTSNRNVSAHVAMVLVGVSLLDTKQMRSRQLTSFCQPHKSDQKHMSSQKVFTSRHGLFV